MPPKASLDAIFQAAQSSVSIETAVQTSLNGLSLQGERSSRSTAHSKVRHTPNQTWVKVGLLAAFFAFLTLLASLVGCILSVKFRRKSKRKKKDVTAVVQGPENTTTIVEDLVESNTPVNSDDMLATTRTDHILANDSFKGRELEQYKQELREKRRALSAGTRLPSSQAITLPIQAHSLKRKMRAFVRSLTRSDGDETGHSTGTVQDKKENGSQVVQNGSTTHSFSANSQHSLLYPTITIDLSCDAPEGLDLKPTAIIDVHRTTGQK